MFKVGMQWGMSWFEGTSSQKPSFKLLTIFLMFCKCAVPSGSKGTCNTLFQPETGETNLTCVPLFSFACGGRVLVVPRGVSDTCHVSQVSPWVTTSPPPSSAPCGSHRYVGDNINIWESVTNGIGHWQGIWPEARNTWNVWPRQIRKLRVFWSQGRIRAH